MTPFHNPMQTRSLKYEKFEIHKNISFLNPLKLSSRAK